MGVNRIRMLMAIGNIYRAMKCDEAKFWDVQTHIAVSGCTKEMGNWIESMIGLFLC